MRTIAVINQKGGCGKTTSAINLSGIFARRGCRTLLVDLDPQSHCAAGLAIPEQRIDLDIGDAMVLEERKRLDPTRLLWRVSRNLDLAPSRTRLAGLEAPGGGLQSMPDRELRLAKTLSRLKADYDVCLIDCSPSIGLLTFNAMAAADAVLIPVETSFFSLQGATKQVAAVKTVAKRLNIRLPFWLLPTIHETSSPLAKDLLEELRRRFGRKVTPVAIRRDPALKEASSFGQPVFDYAPTSPGATDYAALAEWLAASMGIMLPTREGHAVELLAMPREAFIADDEDESVDEPDFSDTAAPPPTPSVANLVASVVSADAEGQFREIKPVADAPPSSGLLLQPTRVAAPTSELDGISLSRSEDLSRRAQAFRRSGAPGTPLTIEPPAELPERVARPGGTDTIRRLFGVRQTSQGMLFVQPLAIGARVAVAGQFNNWSDSTHVMKRNDDLGVWELTSAIPPGRYAYRLVVDGTWMADPYNPSFEPNPFGERNSILAVKP